MDFKELINKYFDENSLDINLKEVGIYICRADGISLFGSNKNQVDQIGALVAGVWQASEAMYQQFSAGEVDIEDFRFAFDTSACGVAIFPMIIKGEILFFSVIFNDVANPARLKRLARNCSNSLTDYLSQTYNSKQEKAKSTSVFRGLTDSEIDKAFAFAETN